VPPGVTQFLRLFSDWGGTKLERLRGAGDEVVVLDEGAEKEISGIDVRPAMRAGGDRQSLAPRRVARGVRALAPGPAHSRRRRADGWWLTGRPDPERDADEAERLVERWDGITVDGLTFSLSHVWRGEAVLRISGGADERVTDSDSFFRAWYPMLRPQPLVPEA